MFAKECDRILGYDLVKKCLFPLDAYVVSCPTCTKNLEWYILYIIGTYINRGQGIDLSLSITVHKGKYISKGVFNIILSSEI